MQRVSVQSPEWRFIPTPCGARRHAEYDRGWSLAEAMPVNTPAPVTARDHFVVAFTADELKARIEQFRDLSIPDDEIRRRYFQRTRSARYPLGDTRGWKLAAARRIIAADADWQQSIVRCLYRPFDWRYVFWHPAMIDWPRENVTRHLIGGQSSEFKVQGLKPAHSTLNLELGTLNWCLIARRQQLPTQPCTFFWVCDGLALDGVIRSDNRGSESLFPIYVAGTLRVPLESQGRLWPPSPSDGTRSVPATCSQANFAADFVEQLAAATGLAWLPIGRGDLTGTFGPEDLAAYIYALFHSPTYRDRYAKELRTDFPRVLIPRTADLLRSLCRCGNQLIEQHLLRGPAAPAMDAMDRPALRSQNAVPSTRYSVLRAFAEEACTVGKHPLPIAVPPEVIESFRAGGYVALRKWLQPQHRSASDPEYPRIVAAITRTLEIMPAIDAWIAAHGGWDTGFVS